MAKPEDKDEKETAEQREAAAANRRIYDNIYKKTFEQTEVGINETIEKRKEEGRQGFKGFLFMIAEFIDSFLGTSFAKTLASWNGTPIPEDSEVKAASSQVATATGAALTSENFTYKDKAEFQTNMHGFILEHLKLPENRKNTPSMSDAQLEEIATKATAALTEMYSDKNGNIPAKTKGHSAVDALAEKKVTDAIAGLKPEEKTQLAQLLDKKELTNDDVKIIAQSLAPKLVELSMDDKKAALKNQGDKAFSAVSAELKDGLIARKGKINLDGGFNLDDTRLSVLADHVAESFVKNELGIKTPPKEFVAEKETHKQEAINNSVVSKITTKVSESIVEGSAESVMAGYHEHPFKRQFSLVPTAAIKTMDKYYTAGVNDKGEKTYTPNDVKDETGELEKAKRTAYDYAVSTHKTFTDPQREIVGKIVADATRETINKPENKGLNQEQLVPIIEGNVYTALTANKAKIDEKDPKNKVDTINANTEKDVFAVLSKAYGDILKKEGSEEFKQLSEARAMLNESKSAVATSQAGVKKDGSLSFQDATHEWNAPPNSPAVRPNNSTELT